jgi:transposase-like protein
MNPKDWTPQELRELAELAKRKGYTKGALAGFIGVDPATLSVWMNAERTKPLPLLSRNAVSYIETGLGKLPDLLRPPEKSRRKKAQEGGETGAPASDERSAGAG